MRPEIKVESYRLLLHNALGKLRSARRKFDRQSVEVRAAFLNLQHVTCQYLDAVEEARAAQIEQG